jgi:hypothetical protein
VDNDDLHERVLIWIRIPPPEVPIPPEVRANILGDPERPVLVAKRIMLIPDPKGTETLVVEFFPMPRDGNPEKLAIVGEDGERVVFQWNEVFTNFGNQLHFRVGPLVPYKH